VKAVAVSRSQRPLPSFEALNPILQWLRDETDMKISKSEQPRLLVATEAAVCNKSNLVYLTFNLLMIKLGWVACLTGE
jgi:hypothetical protein